jgi:hypothetical protein
MLRNSHQFADRGCWPRGRTLAHHALERERLRLFARRRYEVLEMRRRAVTFISVFSPGLQRAPLSSATRGVRS